MDGRGLALLEEARSAGLDVVATKGRLVIRGPRAAGAVAERLIADKAAVLSVLADRERRGQGGDPPRVWWNDTVPEGSAPVLHLPPRGCLGPRVCARLGPCDRHAAGTPCRVEAPTSGPPRAEDSANKCASCGRRLPSSGRRYCSPCLGVAS